MPVKPLPAKLVERLKQRAPEIEKLLGGMKNIDPRSGSESQRLIAATDVASMARRVRQMDVARNFPGVELILKNHVPLENSSTRIKRHPAAGLINAIKSAVKQHNSVVRDAPYVLEAPHLYKISKNIIAMSKTNAPTLDAVLSPYSAAQLRTEYDADFVNQAKAHVVELERQGKTVDDLRSAFYALCNNKTHFEKNGLSVSNSNLLYLGIKNGKFHFMPLADDA